MYQKVCFAVLSTILIISSNIFAQIGATVDPTFAPAVSLGTSDDFYYSTIQPDGKIIVSGRFMIANGKIVPNVARINADGSIDNSFNCPACTFSAAKTWVQPDGKILVPGSHVVNGTTKAKMIRINPDGSLDSTFNFQPIPFFGSSSASIEDIQSDGKIYVKEAQTATQFYTQYIYRLNADGSKDSTFTQLAADVRNGEFINFKILPDGRMFAFGRNFYGYLAQINNDGTKNSAFESPALTAQQTTPPASPGIYDIALQSDGKLVFVGYFNSANGISTVGAARLNTNQGVDSSFTPTFVFPAQYGIGKVYAVSNNKLLFVTSTSNINVYIERHNYDGSNDNTFSFPSILNNYKTISVDSMERIYLSGIISIDSNSPSQNIFQRYNANGSLDTSFNPTFESSGQVSVLGLQSDGKVLVGGTYKKINGDFRAYVSRINADGTTDTGFDAANKFTSVPNAFAVQSDGKILVGGNFSYESSNKQLVRLNANGTKDSGFNVTFNTGSSVFAIAVQPDGKILVGGSFHTINGVSSGSRLARLNADGTIDTSFNTQVGNNIETIVLQSNGQIMIGGLFVGINGFNRYSISRLNSDGSLDLSFNAGILPIKKIILLPDGKYLVFALNHNLYRLNSNGSIDKYFTLTGDSTLSDIEVLNDGSIILVGGFTTLNNQSKSRIARLQPNGTLDVFTFVKGANEIIKKVVKQPDGRIIVGGNFTNIEDISRTGLARISVAAFTRPTPFDFDGDGRADISVYRPSNSVWYQLLGSNYQFSSFNFGLSDDVLAPADYDGDGKTDLGIYRPSTGVFWYAASAQNNTFRAVQWGQTGDIPLPSDIDGDGKADYVVYRPSQSRWIRLTVNGVSSTVEFGASGDKPVVGDFDGDGKADPAIYRPSTGAWWYAASSQSGAHRAVQFGLSTDIPVPADFDGDGKTDFAVYRASSGVWHILQSSNGNYVAYQFGLAEDKPVAADYDGDGKADMAVYRPSNGVWYLNRSSAGFTGIQLGTNTDKAIPNAFIP